MDLDALAIRFNKLEAKVARYEEMLESILKEYEEFKARQAAAAEKRAADDASIAAQQRAEIEDANGGPVDPGAPAPGDEAPPEVSAQDPPAT